jgi:hypothetical protein
MIIFNRKKNNKFVNSSKNKIETRKKTPEKLFSLFDTTLMDAYTLGIAAYVLTA